ncbi:MAG: DNA-binding helix-turn-helix protein [Candidatus Kaiserbacteria bacterium GW2011_GWA2_52_12]|uniref:DNA-binding helix-turn-helix protein n=1 Tax=Candidatus Kaiserbacteria bacterium GW2011_GWA2_52_12 TaxID=1618671 RepID=A0A0G1WVL4_9BACT|nr:MAG: DNA-binding helix-turn-helix protein [Candidatus Kaiserbacteria bacterium GW2011_GWA2_52_12]
MKIDAADKANGELKRLIGKRIQTVRSRLGRTAKWVAIRMDIDRSTLSQIETGTIHINAVTLFKLAAILRCDIQDFFPTVPDSSSLTERDVELFAQENAQAAVFLKKAFKPKKS